MGDVFKALADPTRRAILDELAERDGQTLFELCARPDQKHRAASSRQAVSQHLDVLEAAGLVATQREGRYKFHHLDTAAARADRRALAAAATRRRRHEDHADERPRRRPGRRRCAFYTDVLGFVKKTDVPLGEHRWLTVVSPDDPDGVELLLEPDEHPAAGPFKAALVEDGIPFTSFAVDDVQRRVRAAARRSASLHPGASGDGPGDHGGPRRHLRQPDPDHAASSGMSSSWASSIAA